MKRYLLLSLLLVVNAATASEIIDFEGVIETSDPHPTNGVPTRVNTQGFEFEAADGIELFGGGVLFCPGPGCGGLLITSSDGHFALNSIDIGSPSSVAPGTTIQLYGCNIEIPQDCAWEVLPLTTTWTTHDLAGFEVPHDFAFINVTLNSGGGYIHLDNIVVTENRPTVEIDVQPGDPGNNVQTDGSYSDKMYVSIQGSESFDATQVDISSVYFGPASAAPFPTNPYQIKDTNSDGFPDMKVKFRIADAGLTCDMVDEDVTIKGNLTVSPTEYGFIGSDTINTEACEPAGCHP